MAYTKYSLTPANNTATPPDGAPEGMLPSAVNDTMRDMMAQIRDCGDGIRDGTYTMTAAKITGGTITGTTVTSNTFSSSGATITGGTINGTAIGGTTAAAGKFTTLEATGVTTVQAGTVSAPAITTTGDTNTGIFFPAADTIAFTEGGAEAMRIDSSGNVGIGTSSPTARLGIPTPLFTSSATGGMIRFQNPDVAADSCIQSFYVTGAGSNIWIGCNNYIDTNGSTVRFSGSYASSAINLSRDGTLQFYTSTGTATERMRITSAGNVLINATSVGLENGGIQFQPNGNATNVPFIGCAGNSSSSSYISYGLYSASLSQYQFYVDYNGTISARSTSITGLSDISEKENIKPLETGLNEVLALQPRRFDWKNGSGKNIAGFVAQEVETVLPDLVADYKVNIDTTKKGLKMGDMIPTLVKAIQEQQAMIEELKSKVTALENK